jgi:EmrB/QacA subfamily drug resistance transporter
MESTNKKALMALLLAGVLMGALDLAIIGPALPAIQAEFGMTTRGLAWLFNLYVLGQLVGTPLLAKMSDRLGPRPIYITSIFLFAVGSLLLVIGPDTKWLFIGRVIQGFGGAGIFPVAVAVIGDVFPPEKRGSVLGLLGAVFGIAFLIGPILGGILLQFAWQWLFLINIPIAVGLIIGAWRLLPEGTVGKDHKPFDLGGAVTLSVGLTSLAIAVTNADTTNLLVSLTTLQVWPFLLCFLLLTPWFWRLEKSAADPIIKPAFFENRQITMAVSISLGIGAMQSAGAFFPALAVSAMGITAANAAWLLLPGVLCTTIASPLVGASINRVGTRTLILCGLTFIAAGYMIFGLVDVTVAVFITASCVAGLGFASALGAPIRVVVLNEARPEDRGAAQGLLNVSLNIGQLLGAALVGGITASKGGGAPGYQATYTVMGAMTFVLIALALRLRPKTQIGV